MQRDGFSMIELIVTLLFLALAGSAALFILRGQKVGTLENEVEGIKSRLEDVQGKAIAGLNGVGWGIHFENATTSPLYAAYAGPAYVSSTATTYYLSASVAYATTTLPIGSSTEIFFSKLNGAASASTTLTFVLASDPSQTKSILVNSQGNLSTQ